MTRRTVWWQRGTAGATALALVIAQLVLLPPQAEASHLGSSTASAGSAPPPAATTVQSFQPDLFTGRATTSIPIAVPPGRKGMQPSLGLSYSSSSRNGPVGVGWSLDVGYIERSTKTGVPKYDSSDTYTFMFQGVSSDLVQIPDGTYRAKDEGLFLKFINQGSTGWEVRDKSGTLYSFGTAQGSRLEAGGNTFRWALDRVIDVHGNYLTITYITYDGQNYLSHIDYTGHEPTNELPSNTVELLWEDRPDVETSYRSGAELKTTKRLKEITTSAQGQVARKYVLTYTQSTRTGRSLLSSVTQYGTDGVTSLPPATFTYQDTGSATYSVISNNPTSSQAAWNVRQAGLDTGHENFGCVHPYSGLPWGPPQVVTGYTDLGCLNASVSGNGNVTMNGCQDHFGHAFTYVYTSTPKTISVSLTSGSDVDACLWREDVSGVQNIGGGGSVSLQAGWSLLHITGYHQHQGWGPLTLNGSPLTQVDIISPSQFLKPQLSGDVNGDAKTDLIAFDPFTGTWTVSCATSCTLPPAGAWLSGFGTTSSTPLLGDFDADGKTDVAIFTSGTWRFARSTGTSFQADAWPSYSFGGGTPLLGDFNGDGNTDLGTYNSGTWSVALGHTGSFTSAGSFNLGWGDGNDEPLTGDFNGDGLTDIGLSHQSSGNVDIRFSTGTDWTASSQWISGFGANQDHTVADFTGDGLSDLVYYDTSSGQVRYAPSTGAAFAAVVTVPPSFGLRGQDDRLQIGDFNGDGLSDPGVFNTVTGNSQLAISAGPSAGAMPDLLKTMSNGLGGTTALAYQSTCQCGVSFLPFIHYVVQSATASDGLGNAYTTAYLFKGGLYDGATKEFRGFEQATVLDADGNKAVTQFHQDAQKKGRPFATEFRDQYDHLWTKAEQTWGSRELFPGVQFTTLDQTDSTSFDGDDDGRHTRSRLAYDAYGNLMRAEEDGDVALSGDERASATEYAYNEAAWIVGRPTLTQTLDATNTVVAQRRFYYDGASDHTTPPTAGTLSREEEWLVEPASSTPARWLATTLTYDAYGNVVTVTDALGRTTTNTYDAATHTYLETITNTLGHARSLAYDPRTGQTLRSTDQNGLTTLTDYDALGRVIATSLLEPGATTPVPLSQVTYDVSTIPTRTTTTVFALPNHQSPITNYQFFDGLGRTIQTRSPAEDPNQQIVTGAVELNGLGQVVKQWVPYVSEASSSYVPLTLEPRALDLAVVTYTYDPLGRLLTVTDPDNAMTTTAYDDGTVTVTDANGHSTRRTADASGRLVKVEELNTGNVYTTTYAYDALNNLTQTRDHVGNLIQISYDSLSRKIAMDDPDMGVWSYTYDDVDNLLTQTDARGVITDFRYDALNRLLRKSYLVPSALNLEPPASVSYTYDTPPATIQPLSASVRPAAPGGRTRSPQPIPRPIPLPQPITPAYTKGKLTAVSDGSGSSRFEYDALGRLVKEIKVVDGRAYTITRAYDLLGRLTELTYPDGDMALYTYNPQGGIETVDLFSSSLPDSLTPLLTHVDYNAAGQLTKIEYGNGVITDYAYDPRTLRLATLSTQHTATSIPLQNFSYQFDAVGNVQAITDALHTGTQTFDYDDLNRLARATGAYGEFTYAYDPLGNLLEKEGLTMTYGEGTAGPHAVTSVHSPQSIVNRLTYDQNGNLLEKTIDYGPSTIDRTAQQFQYDAENRLIEVATAPEEAMTLHFEPGWNFFSLPVIPEEASITTLLPNFSADFEQVARLVPAQSPEPSAPSQFEHFVNDPEFNDFDTLDYGRGYQLYCENPHGVTLELTGKLPTSIPPTPLSPGWHLLPSLSLEPRPLNQVFGGIDAAQVLAYDTASGSLTTAQTVEPGQAYLVQVATSSTFAPPLPRDPLTKFVYDGDGGRVQQITAAGTTTYLGESVELAPDGTTTLYLFVGAQRIAALTRTPDELHAARPPPATNRWATLWRQFLTWLDIPSADAATLPAGLRFYHGDHLGSTNVITDSTGAVVEQREYTPFGSVASGASSASDVPSVARESPFGFTGQRQDGAHGLILFPARAYDPQLGRFLQPDPFIQDPSDPQTLNRYTYVRNNPVALVDPSGYNWFKKFLVWWVGKILGEFFFPENPYYQQIVINATQTGYEAYRAGQDPWRAAAIEAAGTAAELVTASIFINLGADPRTSAQAGEATGDLVRREFGEAWEEAEAIAQDLGVAAGAAANFITQALVVPAASTGQAYQRAFSSNVRVGISTTLGLVGDRDFFLSRLRLKIGFGKSLGLSFVKRYGNNKFFMYGSRAFGNPTKSIGLPVVKTIGRSLGAISLATDLHAAARAFGSGDYGEFSRQIGFTGIDSIGLFGSPFFPPLRFVPPLVRAVDLSLQEFLD